MLINTLNNFNYLPHTHFIIDWYLYRKNLHIVRIALALVRLSHKALPYQVQPNGDSIPWPPHMAVHFRDSCPNHSAIRDFWKRNALPHYLRGWEVNMNGLSDRLTHRQLIFLVQAQLKTLNLVLHTPCLKPRVSKSCRHLWSILVEWCHYKLRISLVLDEYFTIKKL